MSFKEYVIYRLKYFWYIYLLNRRCYMCRGSNGHCDKCNKWKNLYKRDYKRMRVKRKRYKYDSEYNENAVAYCE